MKKNPLHSNVDAHGIAVYELTEAPEIIWPQQNTLGSVKHFTTDILFLIIGLFTASSGISTLD